MPPRLVLKVSVTTRGEHVVCCLGELHLEQSLKVGPCTFGSALDIWEVGLRLFGSRRDRESS